MVLKRLTKLTNWSLEDVKIYTIWFLKELQRKNKGPNIYMPKLTTFEAKSNCIYAENILT